MDIDNIREQIENDLEWRLDEIAFFTAQLNHLRPLNTSDKEKQRVEKDKNRFRKALVLILYAHFEGLVRYALRLYAEALNEENINLSEAIDVLVASSLHREFGQYDDSKERIKSESSEFNKANKRLNNRVNLIQELNQLWQENKVKLPISDRHNDKGSVLYTESNLNFDTIEKILYRLGFPTDILDLEISGRKFKDILNEFLGRRNAIAHGDKLKKGIDEKQYNEFKNVFDKITIIIPIAITKALNKKLYLKKQFR